MSVNFDCRDDTTGTGTANTANTWKDNQGSTSQPPGLCRGDGDNDDDDDDFDHDGDRDDHDMDDDNDGQPDEVDQDDDNDGQLDIEDDDDDNDGIKDDVDDRSTHEKQQSSSGTLAGGQNTDYTMTADSTTLALTVVAEAPNAEFLTVEVYDAAGLLMGVSPTAVGAALIKVPVGLAGDYTVRVRNVSLTPVDYIVRLVRSSPW
jgi:hypothetical protein